MITGYTPVKTVFPFQINPTSLFSNKTILRMRRAVTCRESVKLKDVIENSLRKLTKIFNCRPQRQFG